MELCWVGLIGNRLFYKKVGNENNFPGICGIGQQNTHKNRLVVYP